MAATRRIAAVCLGLVVATMSRGEAEAGIITASNSTVGAIGNGSATRTVTFDGSESGYDTGLIKNVTASIAFGKAAFLALPRLNQMAFSLTNPSGTVTVNLIKFGDFGQGAAPLPFLAGVTFDDAAANVVNVSFNPLALFGTYRPTESTPNNFLANFDGGLALGTWTLTIQNSGSGAPIGFANFTLTIETIATPEPSTLALAGSGFAVALVGYGRRRRARAAA